MRPEELRDRDLVLHLATLRRDGSPRITPLWFVFEDGTFRMTSVSGKRHLRDLARDQRCAVIVDAEIEPAADGERRYARLRASGLAELTDDPGGAWTRRITLKYVRGPEGERLAERRARDPRVLIALRVDRLSATATRERRERGYPPPPPKATPPRRAVPDDAAALRTLLNAAYGDLAKAGLNFTAATQDEALTRQHIQTREVYVLERDGELSATVTLRDRQPTGDVRHIYINALAVAPAHQRGGLGKALLDFAESVARERDVNVLRLDTAIPATHLVALYSRAGYRVTGRRRWKGKTYESLIMEKALDARMTSGRPSPGTER